MKLSNGVKIREEKLGTVIFETLNEKVFITNECGKDILKLLKDGKSEREIIEILFQNYEAEKQKIENDTLKFIDRLRTNQIIKT